MVLIAGGQNEFTAYMVIEFIQYLMNNNLTHEIILQASENNYKDIESQIDKCDVFVIIIGFTHYIFL